MHALARIHSRNEQQKRRHIAGTLLCARDISSTARISAGTCVDAACHCGLVCVAHAVVFRESAMGIKPRAGGKSLCR